MKLCWERHRAELILSDDRASASPAKNWYLLPTTTNDVLTSAKSSKTDKGGTSQRVHHLV